MLGIQQRISGNVESALIELVICSGNLKINKQWHYCVSAVVTNIHYLLTKCYIWC